MAVEVKENVSFAGGVPKALFETPRLPAGPRYHYTVTADGQRFLFLTPAGETAHRRSRLWSTGQRS